jgi:hypothetical protein
MGPGYIPWYNWNQISQAAVVNEQTGSVLQIPVIDIPTTFNKVDAVAVIQQFSFQSNARLAPEQRRHEISPSPSLVIQCSL